jgi:hypothetical protein
MRDVEQIDPRKLGEAAFGEALSGQVVVIVPPSMTEHQALATVVAGTAHMLTPEAVPANRRDTAERALGRMTIMLVVPAPAEKGT